MGKASGGNPPRVILIGDANIDLHLELPEPLRPGGDGVASSQRTGLGGSAANTAVVLRRLGVDATMLSSIGSDSWGSLVEDALRAEGIDGSHIVRDSSEPTSLNIVAVTPDGERTMLAYRGASARFAPAHVPERVVLTGSHVHVSGYTVLEAPQSQAAARVMELARAAGVPVSLDVPVDPARLRPESLRAMLPVTDLLIVGSAEAQELVGTGEPRAASAAFHELGVRTVAYKLGAKGTLMSRPGEMVELPALPVEAVDTTGAGDAFCGAAIAAMLCGMSLAEIGMAANVYGACATSRFGAGRSLPELSEVLALEERCEAGGVIRRLVDRPGARIG